MNNKYWEEEIETMPREQLRELQLQRLKRLSALPPTLPTIKSIPRAWHHCRQHPVYRRHT